MSEAKSDLLSVTQSHQVLWKDTEAGLNTHLLKGTSEGSRACHLHGSELWIGGRGWHIHPLHWCQLLCGCDLTKWHQACGRCEWNRRPSSGIPLGTAVPWPPAGCPETWKGSAIWNGYWPWRRLCSEAVQKVTLVWSNLTVSDLTLRLCKLSPSRNKIQ